MSPSTGSGGPCGSPHDAECSEVLDRIYYFIDNELDNADRSELQHHLDECLPCLQKYNLERTVKALVARSCSEHAPQTLREKLLLQLRAVRVELETKAD